MASSFQHVTYEERCKIDALRAEGLSLSEITRRLEHSQSTLVARWPEIARAGPTGPTKRSARPGGGGTPPRLCRAS